MIGTNSQKTPPLPPDAPDHFPLLTLESAARPDLNALSSTSK